MPRMRPAVREWWLAKLLSLDMTQARGYSSAGRALAWHARGRRFDPA